MGGGGNQNGSQVNVYLDLGPEDTKPIICLDFDGVIHLYSEPWKGPGIIEDGMVPGFLDWAAEAQKYFRLVIYSARSRTDEGIQAMRIWLHARMIEWYEAGGSLTVQFNFEFAYEKPKAFLTIDDRAIQFDGDWSAMGTKQLLSFKPWNKRAL